jgi:hypothetical protein
MMHGQQNIKLWLHYGIEAEVTLSYDSLKYSNFSNKSDREIPETPNSDIFGATLDASNYIMMSSKNKTY